MDTILLVDDHHAFQTVFGEFCGRWPVRPWMQARYRMSLALPNDDLDPRGRSQRRKRGDIAKYLRSRGPRRRLPCRKLSEQTTCGRKRSNNGARFKPGSAGVKQSRVETAMLERKTAPVQRLLPRRCIRARAPDMSVVRLGRACFGDTCSWFRTPNRRFLLRPLCR